MRLIHVDRHRIALSGPLRSKYVCKKHSACRCTLGSGYGELRSLPSLCGTGGLPVPLSYSSNSCPAGRYPDSKINCNEISVPDSFTTPTRTASHLRCSGSLEHVFAYPKLQPSSSLLSGTACSCPGAAHVPRQAAPSGSLAGCGSARSSARSVGTKNGQAKLVSLNAGLR